MTAQRPIKRRPIPDGVRDLHIDGIDPLLAQIYKRRGITATTQLDYGLAQLQPVGTLGGIDAAVDLLLRHRERAITVVGDFDADGATSTALVLRCLRRFGFNDVRYLVPNRFDYGYGLTPEIVAVALRDRPSLLVTVDNGISSVTGVQAANDAGVEVLVTDHHLPGAELPDAAVLLNPNLPDNGFASGNLAGVGVAFYLMAAVGRRLQEQGVADAARIPAEYLDLVALGTVADVVTLDHNNRVLIQQGLQRLRSGKSVPGIGALLNCAGRRPARAVSADLGFVVGPRLNAAGRLDDISLGIECLLTDDAERASQLASELDSMNKQRREIEDDMRQQAFAAVDKIGFESLPACVCLYETDWHQGIVGLLASRVKERCHRPVIAFAREADGWLKGSARSVQGVHIRDLLEAIATAQPGLIERFGGHAMAAGLSIREPAFTAFAAAADAALRQLYPDADFSGAIVTDGALPSTALTLQFAKTLRDAGPWGAGFPEPMFDGDFAVLEQRTVGENHLKMRVKASDGATIDAIAFNQAGAALRGSVKLSYRLDVNEYRGFERPQLVVEQIA